MTDSELRDALDGLFAYDVGATDSGVHDENLRARCVEELATRTPEQIDDLIWSMWLTEARRSQGYTQEDADEFTEWLSDRMDVAER